MPWCPSKSFSPTGSDETASPIVQKALPELLLTARRTKNKQLMSHSCLQDLPCPSHSTFLGPQFLHPSQCFRGLIEIPIYFSMSERLRIHLGIANRIVSHWFPVVQALVMSGLMTPLGVELLYYEVSMLQKLFINNFY